MISLALAVLAFIASCITLLGAFAAVTKTNKDDRWYRRLKDGYYWLWVRAILLANAYRVWRKKRKEPREF